MTTEAQIIETIKDLLLNRLELAESGVTADQITNDLLLLDESGLGLDSVEALDLLVGIEKSYGIQIPELNKDFIEKTCTSVQSLLDFVVSVRVQTVA